MHIPVTESLESAEQQPSKPWFRTNSAQQFCLFILCADFLSAFANEFSMRWLGTNAYVSVVSAVLLPIALVMSGTVQRCMRLPLTRYWLAFGAWLAVCAPFSIWKTGTLDLLFSYYFRTYLLYFAICACAVSAKQLTTVMYTLAAGTGLTVLLCLAFGVGGEYDRFAVPSSHFSFLSNSNDLAFMLLFGIIILIYPFFRKRTIARFASLALIPTAAVFMLKTGSRGVLLSLASVLIAALLTSRHKARLVALGFVLFLGAVITVPAAMRHRLMYIALPYNSPATLEAGDPFYAAASQEEREGLLAFSIHMTLDHPIFGVGPGQFARARWNQMNAKGEWAHLLGTHNSYTEVSSETGIPGLFFYVACIVLCFQMNYRTYRKTVSRKGLEEYAGLSFCMLLAGVMYSVSTLFFHISYTSYLPIIAGISSATYLAVERQAHEQQMTVAAKEDVATFAMET